VASYTAKQGEQAPAQRQQQIAEQEYDQRRDNNGRFGGMCLDVLDKFVHRLGIRLRYETLYSKW